MCDTLTVDRLEIYSQYWKDHPPLHILAAAFLGIKPAEKGSHDELFDMLGGAQQIEHEP